MDDNIQNLICPMCDYPLKGGLQDFCPNCKGSLKVELLKRGNEIWGKVWRKLPLTE